MYGYAQPNFILYCNIPLQNIFQVERFQSQSLAKRSLWGILYITRIFHIKLHTSPHMKILFYVSVCVNFASKNFPDWASENQSFIKKYDLHSIKLWLIWFYINLNMSHYKNSALHQFIRIVPHKFSLQLSFIWIIQLCVHACACVCMSMNTRHSFSFNLFLY